jgi:hypothetical protein
MKLRNKQWKIDKTNKLQMKKQLKLIKKNK